jgi:hypothetical protein
MIKLVLLSAIFAIAGCADGHQKVNSYFDYYMDDRTGLCFYGNVGYGPANAHFLTNVPCTPEVLKEIEISRRQ